MYRKPPLSFAVSDWSVIQTSYALAVDGSTAGRFTPTSSAREIGKKSLTRFRLRTVADLVIGVLLAERAMYCLTDVVEGGDVVYTMVRRTHTKHPWFVCQHEE